MGSQIKNKQKRQLGLFVDGTRPADLPTSMEAVRYRVMGITHCVEREITMFNEKYMTPENFSIQDINNFFSDVSKKTGSSFNNVDAVKEWKDLELILNSVKTNSDFIYRWQYYLLRSIFDRDKTFQNLTQSLLNDLHLAYEYLQKYCNSFVAETNGLNVACVRDYENSIIDWTEGINEIFTEVNSCCGQINTLRLPFAKCLGQYSTMFDLMTKTCNTILSICTPMKHWVMADTCYPHKIQGEITRLTQLLTDKRDSWKTATTAKEHELSEWKRNVWTTAKLDRRLAEAKNRKRRLRQEELSTKDQWETLSNDLIKMRRQLETVKEQLHSNRKQSLSTVQLLIGKEKQIIIHTAS